MNPKHTADSPTAPGRAAATALPALSRRGFLRLAAGAIALACAGGCRFGAPSASRQADKPIQLVYQDWRTDWFPPMAQQMLNEFHARQPDIRVFYTPDPEDLEEQMPRDMAAGTAPDVFAGCCGFFPIWAQKGYCLDLRPYVEAHLDPATITDWDKAQYEWFFRRDGLQFGLPKYHGALALYYNLDLFDQAGVAYPTADWDHDDYLEAMKRLTRDADGDGRTDQWGSMIDISWDRIQMHVNGWGGHLVDPLRPTVCLMDRPEAMAAMEWIRARMWDDKVMATSRDVEIVPTRQAFAEGRLAMVEDGSWSLKEILSKAQFRVGVAPFPAGPARRVTLASTDGFGIYANTRHREAAWALLEFLISPEYGRAMARANFLQPARASLIAEWAEMIRAEFPEQSRNLDLPVFADGHLKGYSVTAEVFADMARAKQVTDAAWRRIFELGEDPVDLMANVCSEIEKGRASSQEGGGFGRKVFE